MADKTRIAWSDATCRKCAVTLTTENRVEQNRSLCKTCRNAQTRSRYIKKGRPGKRGWLVPTRDGDKLQARRRVNYLVEQSRIPHPNDLPCTDCLDETYPDPAPRHEYDHARGYDGDNQLYVEAVCSRCHHNREESRRAG